MDQLDEELELKRNDGSKFTMNFTVKAKKQASIKFDHNAYYI
jgi:hypothetical protein